VAEADFDAVRKWVAMLPTDEESIRAEVEPFRDMTPAERLRWWVQL
jgi:hypothetical protein